MKTAARELQSKYGVTPGLAIIEVGTHSYGQLLDFSGLEPDGVEKLSEQLEEQKVNLSNYAELKARMAERCGMHVQILRFSETVPQARLIRVIRELMEEKEIHGILVELPLPQHLNEMEVLQEIGPSKDVDGLAFANLGRLMVAGGYKSGAEPASRPTVPMGVMELLLRSKARPIFKAFSSNLWPFYRYFMCFSSVFGRFPAFPCGISQRWSSRRSTPWSWAAPAPWAHPSRRCSWRTTAP